MYQTINEWKELLGHPSYHEFKNSRKITKIYELEFGTCELALQANGPETFQRIMTVIPRGLHGKAPAVAVPFYYPEAMMGFDPETQEPLALFKGISMLADLAKRGYIAASADAYHLTYAPSSLDRDDFSRWELMSGKLLADHPQWTGMGKLFADTELLIDSLAADPRVDPEKLGIAGHSLGGKMAFYAGCLDPRIKVTLTSDFGFDWDRSNWEQPWYWGEHISELKQKGIHHTGLLSAAAPKPFALLAGLYDNADCETMMRAASGYTDEMADRLLLVNHASGHRPPADALEKGYAFLDRFLKE